MTLVLLRSCALPAAMACALACQEEPAPDYARLPLRWAYGELEAEIPHDEPDVLGNGYFFAPVQYREEFEDAERPGIVVSNRQHTSVELRFPPETVREGFVLVKAKWVADVGPAPIGPIEDLNGFVAAAPQEGGAFLVLRLDGIEVRPLVGTHEKSYAPRRVRGRIALPEADSERFLPPVPPRDPADDEDEDATRFPPFPESRDPELDLEWTTVAGEWTTSRGQVDTAGRRYGLWLVTTGEGRIECTFAEGRRTGPWIERRRSGERTLGTVEDGRQTGPWLQTYGSGGLREIWTYGERSAEVVRWTAEGRSK